MIHAFTHHAMATHFQVRIAGEDALYAEQAAQAAFGVADALESSLSRFREESEISRIARLQPGENMRLTEPVFACLETARAMKAATSGAFSPTPAARSDESGPPRWSLDAANFSFRCHAGRVELDLGAIGKGFALDRMAELLAEWECPAHLLVAGGSSVLAGTPPPGLPGWDSGLGDANAGRRYWLTHGSLSGSGTAVKGAHILDPRTGKPAARRERVWAFAPAAAVSDALSTACFVLPGPEIAAVVAGNPAWGAVLQEEEGWRVYGKEPSRSSQSRNPGLSFVSSRLRRQSPDSG